MHGNLPSIVIYGYNLTLLEFDGFATQPYPPITGRQVTSIPARSLECDHPSHLRPAESTVEWLRNGLRGRYHLARRRFKPPALVTDWPLRGGLRRYCRVRRPRRQPHRVFSPSSIFNYSAGGTVYTRANGIVAADGMVGAPTTR